MKIVSQCVTIMSSRFHFHLKLFTDTRDDVDECHFVLYHGQGHAIFVDTTEYFLFKISNMTILTKDLCASNSHEITDMGKN